MSGRNAARRIPAWALWLLFVGLTWAISHYSRDVARQFGLGWMLKMPTSWQPDFAGKISMGMDWLLESATVFGVPVQVLTRGFATVLTYPYDCVRAFLVTGLVADGSVILRPLGWFGVTLSLVALGHYVKSWRLAALVGACFLYIALFGQWDSAMVSLASILIALPIAGGLGLLLGILAFRHATVEQMLRPVLDLMQTVPVFAYLVPILVLFGFGPIAALIATIIYAMPPMIRVTIVALRAVPPSLAEMAVMVGSTPRQVMWKVLVPAARPRLMVGINQVIMLTLNMVIIASMIGAGGLGYDVLTALRRLDIGKGMEAGFAIVALAIALDRLSQAMATRSVGHSAAQASGGFFRRHRWVLGAVVAIGVSYVIAGPLHRWPESETLSTSSFWKDAVTYINLHYFDAFETLKTILLIWFLVPVKLFFLGIPWPWGIAAMTLIGWSSGGWRIGLLSLVMTTLIALSGLWDKAMITLYLCSVGVILATVIGVPLGILSTRSPWTDRIVGTCVDTLQTLPSFCYLIPVVMLFQVGDFSAVIAIVLFALAPAVRYAAQGIRAIDPQVIEAGIVSGCSPWQLLWRVKLPVIMPDLLIGLNQTVMLALSMLVITALVGTRDLGQEVYIALTSADSGRGIVAGLAVAFIAIMIDRILEASVKRARSRQSVA